MGYWGIVRIRAPRYGSIYDLAPKLCDALEAHLEKSKKLNLNRDELKDLVYKYNLSSSHSTFHSVENTLRYFYAAGLIDKLEVDERSTDLPIKEIVLPKNFKEIDKDYYINFFKELELDGWNALYLLYEIKLKNLQVFTKSDIRKFKRLQEGKINKSLEWLIENGFLENGDGSFKIKSALRLKKNGK